MRVLLTGGAGFIGWHVAERLLDRSLEVIAVDDLSSGKRENVPEGARFCEEAVRSGCEKVFQELRPEVLCHQAAHIDVHRSVLEPDFDVDVNVLGTVRLLQNCVRYGVGRVVFASSGGAIYGEQNEFPASEDHPQCPVSPYGVSKLAGERYLHYYHVQYGVSYAALRYANVYGPRQDPHGEAGVVAIFSKNLTAQRVSTINGRGEQTRDYTYVGDVARANVLALEGDPPSGAYNVGTAAETTVNELYELLQDLSGEDLPARHGPGQVRRATAQFHRPGTRESCLWLAPAGAIGRRPRRDPTVRRSALRDVGTMFLNQMLVRRWGSCNTRSVLQRRS